jgi:hypothetical protein
MAYSGALLQPEPYAPSLKCCLTHWYELRPNGEKIGSVNNRRLASISSQNRVARRQGIDALRGAIWSGVKGERAFEAVLLPIGAALFQDVLPFDLVLRHLRHGQRELRSAAVFASSYYSSTDLSVEIAEELISDKGDKLILQAMREVLDLRSRTSSGGKCRRCGERGTRQLQQLDWLPHRAM